MQCGAVEGRVTFVRRFVGGFLGHSSLSSSLALSCHGVAWPDGRTTDKGDKEESSPARLLDGRTTGVGCISYTKGERG